MESKNFEKELEVVALEGVVGKSPTNLAQKDDYKEKKQKFTLMHELTARCRILSETFVF